MKDTKDLAGNLRIVLPVNSTSLICSFVFRNFIEYDKFILFVLDIIPKLLHQIYSYHY
jgi:hypothetical protein